MIHEIRKLNRQIQLSLLDTEELLSLRKWAAARESLSEVITLSENSENIIKDVKVFSGFRTENEEIKIEELLKRMKKLAEAYSGHKHKIELQIEGGIPSTYSNDRDLSTVLFNILSNAVDFSKGVINIHAKYLKDEKRIIVTIQDYGIGMTEEVKSKIYDLFFSTKGKAGFGIGMYLVKKLSASLFISIDFESTVGKGTKFKVSIPIVEKPKEKEVK
jgi:two-component system sporulation sensor kinase B